MINKAVISIVGEASRVRFSFKTDTPFDINVLTRFSLRFSFCMRNNMYVGQLIGKARVQLHKQAGVFQ